MGRARVGIQPNLLVRWAFYSSIFSIPFTKLYLPGTGDRLGVSRLIQVLVLCAVISQPRLCLRMVPVALFWFLAYCGAQILGGLWLTPEMSGVWWPRTLELLQMALPWLWLLFNLFQFPNLGRRSLWAFIFGCAVCSLCHIAGIGVQEIDRGIEGRSSVFGENANVVGAANATAMIAAMGLAMFRETKLTERLALLALVLVIGISLAKTGSRTGALMLAAGVIVLVTQGRVFGSKLKRYGSVMILALLLLVIEWQIPTVKQRIENVDSSNIQKQEGRVRMLPVLWEMFLRSPIYGLGPDGYQYELTRRSMPYLLKDLRLISSHNLPLRVLVETGIIGLALFSTGVAMALMGAWRARNKSCGPLPLALLVPFILAGLTVSDPSPHLAFWFAIAFSLAGPGWESMQKFPFHQRTIASIR